MYLKDLKLGQSGYVKEVNGNADMIIRLYDLGLIEGTKIKLLLSCNGIKAYNFRNSLIAIRDYDASNIVLGDIYG